MTGDKRRHVAHDIADLITDAEGFQVLLIASIEAPTPDWPRMRAIGCWRY